MTSQLVAYDHGRTLTAGARILVGTPAAAASAIASRGLSVRHILAPLDGSSVAACTLPFVTAVAQAFSARVTVLHVLESASASRRVPDVVDWELRRAEAYARLTKAESALQSDRLTTTAEIAQGNAAEQIADFAKTHHADLVVLSSHGAGGLNTWSLGATVERVTATTNASVLIVPASRTTGNRVRFRKMLLPLDCSLRAEGILPAAIALARVHGARLILAHVVAEPAMPRRMLPSNEDRDLAERIIGRNRSEATLYLADIQQRLSAFSDGVEVRIVRSSRCSEALRDLAAQEEVDLVILSAHGGTGDVKRRYGDVASQFLHQGDKPVIILQDLAAVVESRWALGHERSEQ